MQMYSECDESIYIYTHRHTENEKFHKNFFKKNKMKHEKLTKLGKENFKFAIPRLNLFFEKT